MKFILLLSMCSYVSGNCLPPYEWPVKFDSGYDCSIAGYEEAARKLTSSARQTMITAQRLY